MNCPALQYGSALYWELYKSMLIKLRKFENRSLRTIFINTSVQRSQLKSQISRNYIKFYDTIQQMISPLFTADPHHLAQPTLHWHYGTTNGTFPSMKNRTSNSSNEHITTTTHLYAVPIFICYFLKSQNQIPTIPLQIIHSSQFPSPNSFFALPSPSSSSTA